MAKKELWVAPLAKKVGLNDGVLVLRPNASKMFEISKSELGELAIGDLVVCNLQNIVDCSSSFVDEFILGWQRVIRQKDNVMLILTNLSEDVRYTVECSINQRNKISRENFSIVTWNGDHYEVLGNKLEKNALQVFDLMTEGKHITVRSVADKFALELNSAGNRLKKLYDARVVMRAEQSLDAGGKYEYFIPEI